MFNHVCYRRKQSVVVCSITALIVALLVAMVLALFQSPSYAGDNGATDATATTTPSESPSASPTTTDPTVTSSPIETATATASASATTTVTTSATPTSSPTVTPEPPPTSPPFQPTTFEKRCLSGVLVTGHRGMGIGVVSYKQRRYAEDGIRGFKKALDLGACAFETDYWQSSDGCAISIHDRDFNRMTNGTGLVAHHTCSYALSRWTPTHTRLATFARIQKTMAKYAPWTCFRQHEIKPGGFSNAVAKQMDAVLDRWSKAPECNVFTSSELSSLKQFNDLNDRYETAYIQRTTNTVPNLNRMPSWLDRVNVDYHAVTRSYVQQANARGIDVSARNVESRAVFKRMKSWGVKYVVTDTNWKVARLR